MYNKKILKGSLTLEVAISLPIFLVIMCYLMLWFSILKEEIRLNDKALSTARNLAKISYNTENYEDIEVSKGGWINGKYFMKIAVARPFVGRKYRSNSKEDNDRSMVFVTKSGSVYHRSNICRHINLKVSRKSLDDLAKIRNKNGGKYYMCRYCKYKKQGNSIFVSENGKRYHKIINCAGIKRDIVMLSLREAIYRGYIPCKHCG